MCMTMFFMSSVCIIILSVRFCRWQIVMKRDYLTNNFWMNVLLESHATHLRNLIHFFSGKDSISATTVLRENP